MIIEAAGKESLKLKIPEVYSWEMCRNLRLALPCAGGKLFSAVRDQLLCGQPRNHTTAVDKVVIMKKLKSAVRRTNLETLEILKIYFTEL